MAVRYLPLVIPPGVVSDDSGLAAGERSRVIVSDKVRWRDIGGSAVLESIGGWHQVGSAGVAGVARGAHGWSRLSGDRIEAIGTDLKLYLLSDEMLFDITPLVPLPIGRAAFSTSAGTSILTVFDDQPITLGTTVYLGPLSIGSFTCGGTTGTYSADAVTTAIGKHSVQLRHSSHGLQSGDLVTISGLEALADNTPPGGIPLEEWNRQHSVVVLDRDTYLIDMATAATSEAYFGAQTAPVQFATMVGYPVTAIDDGHFTLEIGIVATETGRSIGPINAVRDLLAGPRDTLGRGYGMGPYGAGPYGRTLDADQVMARTWSLQNFGQDLIANPRGGALYRWHGGRTWRAEPLAANDAPARVSAFVVTANDFIMCLGCTNEDGVFDPLLARWATIAGGYADGDWTAAPDNSAGSLRLPVGSSLIAGIAAPYVTLAFTDKSVYALRFVPSLDVVYSEDKIADNGLIGPNAAAMLGTAVLWISAARTWHMHTESGQTRLACPVRELVFNRVPTLQVAKIAAVPVHTHDEVWWFYPDQTGECAQYVAFNVTGGWWMTGSLSRSIGCDSHGPLMVAPTGEIFRHESGDSANGARLEWSFTTGFTDVAEGERLAHLSEFIPDLAALPGVAELTVLGREQPNQPAVSKGPYGFSTRTRKVSMRMIARQFAFKISGVGRLRLGRCRLGFRNSTRRNT